jgi:2-hydroxychromene-2-carboxylate isomerase
MTRATFYFDLGSPYAYLAAERLAGELPAEQLAGERGVAERAVVAPPDSVAWQPVSLGALFNLAGRSSWSLGDPERRRAGIAEVERRAELYGLPPLRWPEPWPSNYLFAMRACTYAFQVGVGREFALRAFRSSFQHGHDLGLPEHVLALAGEMGLEPGAVREATEDPGVKLALRTATEAAHGIGVFGVPTLAVGEELFWGEDRLQDAVAAAG